MHEEQVQSPKKGKGKKAAAAPQLFAAAAPSQADLDAAISVGVAQVEADPEERYSEDPKPETSGELPSGSPAIGQPGDSADLDSDNVPSIEEQMEQVGRAAVIQEFYEAVTPIEEAAIRHREIALNNGHRSIAIAFGQIAAAIGHAKKVVGNTDYTERKQWR
jgi:hypothetical protein